MNFVGTQFSPRLRVFRETVFQDKPKLYKVKDMEVTFVGKIKVILVPDTAGEGKGKGAGG